MIFLCDSTYKFKTKTSYEHISKNDLNLKIQGEDFVKRKILKTIRVILIKNIQSFIKIIKVVFEILEKTIFPLILTSCVFKIRSFEHII